ncbi:MAG: MopE-related protein [Patescibacteria group bacterium]
MTSMYRSALLWAGLFTLLLTLTGCPPEDPGDGGMCNSCPCNSALCVGDGGMDADSGNTCTPTGAEAGHCSDGVDNDCDGLKDGADTVDCPSSSCNTPETTRALCTDGVDNDCNGMKDNVNPGMDPNCEPMSCTPGISPGVDTAETRHRTSHCWDESWEPAYHAILTAPQQYSCCPSGGGTCTQVQILYQNRINTGYEATVAVSGSVLGDSYVFEANQYLVSYRTSGNWTMLHMETDGSVTGQVLTGSASAPTVVSTLTCTR